MGATPLDIVDALPLSDGDYLLQNLGPGILTVNDQDAAVADPATIVDGHVLTPLAQLGIKVDGNAIYVFSRNGSNVAVSEF